MIKRFIDGMKTSERRRVFYALLGGKALGLGLLFLIIAGIPHYFGHKAFADDAAAAVPAYVNPMNNMWVLVTAFLVFFMQAGFMFLEAGFARTRETVNVLLEGIVDTCLCGLLFWAFGLRVHVRRGERLHRPPVLLPARRARHLRVDRRLDPGVLPVPVRLRRHLLDHHLGRHGRPHRVRGRPRLQLRRLGLHLPDLRPLGLGSGRLAEHHPPGRLPRLRRLDGRPHDRRHGVARGRHRPRTAHRTQVQARRRRGDARPRHDHRGRRRRHPLVRLVRLQPGQHAVRHGRGRHRARRRQHHAGGLRRWSLGACSGCTRRTRCGTAA